MKKFTILAAAALLVGAASCNTEDAGNGAKFFSAQATDSLVIASAQAAGYNLNSQFTQAFMQDSTLNKEMFVKGLQYALAADTTQSYIIGVNIGMRMLEQLNRYQSMGLDIDRGKFLNEFKKAFLADSMPTQAMLVDLDVRNRKWNDSLQSAKRAFDIRVLQESDEAKENLERGKVYIQAQKAQNDSVKISDSGLGYKIDNAGEGRKVDVNGVANIKYVAKNADGRVIDRREAMPVRIANMPEGLKEGLAMLGAGGKATLYVPGNLGYGVEVPGRLELGLNELVIYEVEVIEVPEAPGAQAPGAVQVVPGR